MKAFNLEEALLGKTVTTKSGIIVSDIHKFKGVDENKYLSLYAVVEGRPLAYSLDGKRDVLYSDYDLFMYHKPRKGYVNIYEDGSTSSQVYPSEEDANRVACSSKRVACVRVEW